MCMEDYRVGNLIRTIQHPATSGIALTTVPPNPARVGLLLSCTDVGGLANEDVLAVQDVQFGNDYFRLESGAPPFMISMKDHGILPTLQFVLFTLQGTANYTWCEFIMPVEYLAVNPDDYRTNYWKK